MTPIREAVAQAITLAATQTIGIQPAVFADAALAVIRERLLAPTPEMITAAVHAREETGLTSAAIKAAVVVALGDGGKDE
ncbi:hypothetical protein KPL78_19330 [Roseomonas sp. HJA6]|uniref:Uncharacterized protein n=1 Tax=Roseomonas alba TaxID=2846776 RepID=A0ABS7AE59_9PROT|nr:hypothetical protein [Neoroseomonas alba]MBW6400022.1 hypothetical protein [Neoroseomonas alba]